MLIAVASLATISLAQANVTLLGTFNDRDVNTKLGLTLPVLSKDKFSLGLFGGFDSDNYLKTLRTPFKDNRFDTLYLGPTLSYRFLDYRAMSLSLTGGYVGTMRKIELPQNSQWNVGLSVGFKF